ncbi:lipocalin family protein [uncultured Alistipes sp.]|jgi:hypothetical protein|uniref:lipocalin family protein n=1 Tax=uncultured Alistipes sp. TaxID=538949 RepID=UPI0025DB92EB|nr:lipocalin family protein [uncultured Alistipes sp.]
MKNMKFLVAAIALIGMAACCNKTQSFSGVITDASMNTVTVEGTEGTYAFSTMDADKSEANGLLLGAPVTVEYKGKLESGVAAKKVSTDPTYAEAVGEWTMPDPLDSEKVMGVEVMVQGKARSINMATLSHVLWELQGDDGKILLKGMSLGSGAPIQFTQTGVISKKADGTYTMAIEGTDVVYTKTK